MSVQAAIPADQARRRATGVGSIAVLLWATLALGAASTQSIPPFQMTAVTFLVAGSAGAGIARLLGRDLTPAFRQPRNAWILGLTGFFGYHVFYFMAFRLSPSAAVEVNLINYLWPLLIVLFSAIGPGRGLGRAQFIGAAAGLAGCALIVTGRGDGMNFAVGDFPGYLSALACAVLWAVYSVGAGRFCAHVPTEAVIGQCFATSILAAICHLLFETTAYPSAGQLAVAALMGFGPMGAAFYVWDYGVKKGDVQTLGALCYAGPLLSTLLLIVTGAGRGGAHVWLAAAFIIGGAILASKDLLRRK
jgi:drug/metabolite transporter (DMT)-like permease